MGKKGGGRRGGGGGKGGGAQLASGGDRKFAGKEKQRDIRHTNLVAAKAVADLIRTSLGPRGMDKMIISGKDVIITNDGATILNKIKVEHPAAKMVVDVSKAQDVEAGDGTTSVVVITGALLDAAQVLLGKGIHPSIISEAWLLAVAESKNILRSIAIPTALANREALVQAAVTSLNSKVVSDNSPLLAPLAVDAVLRLVGKKGVANLEKGDNVTDVDLSDIKVVKKLGGTVEDTKLVDGLVFDQPASHAAGGPTKIKDAKIGLIQYQLSAPKTNMENSIIIDDHLQIDRVLKEERRYIKKLIKPIIKSGCTLLLIQKSILRDSVNSLSLSFLAKKGIMVIKDIERSDVEYIAQTVGCVPVADPEAFTPEKLGSAKHVEEVSTPGGSMVKVTGVAEQSKTVTILVRGSNKLVIAEAERSVHDALCVVRCLVKEKFLIPGGGCPETALSVKLAKYAERLGGMNGYCVREYARALEVVPYTLAENAGLRSIEVVTELRRRHANNEHTFGVNVRRGAVTDMLEEKVLQPLLVSLSAMSLATECVRMLMKIDDIVGIR